MPFAHSPVIDDLAVVHFLGYALAPNPRSGTLYSLQRSFEMAEWPWERVVELANAYLVTPALWAGLNEKGLADRLPSDLADYLAELHQLNTKRNLGIARQMRDAVRVLNGAGVEPLVLNGVAHLFRNAFRDKGTRIMTDADLLVSEGAMQTAVTALERFGYVADPEKLQRLVDHHHHAPLIKSGEPASIELHRHVLIGRCRHLLPNQAAWANSESIGLEGLCMRVLKPTHRLLHALVHAQIADLGHMRGDVNLRQLHDMAAIATRFQADVQWQTLWSMLDRGGERPALSGTLALLEAFLDFRLPNGRGPGLPGQFHLWRCRRRLASKRFRTWDGRLQNFSVYNMKRQFDPQRGPFPLARARLRYALYLFTRRRRPTPGTQPEKRR